MNYYSTNDTTVNTRIHQNTVDRVKEIPITEIAENLGLELKKSGSGFVALCPFHQEKTPSFHLTDGKGFKCFGCGESGDNIKLYQKFTGVENFRETVEGLAGMFNIPVEYESQDRQQQRVIPLMAKPKLTIATFDSIPDNVEIEISKIADDITEVKTIYRYSETQRVERIERYDTNNNRIEFTLPYRDKSDHKHIFPYHIDDNGNTIKKKGDKPWDFYRQNEAVQFGVNKWVLMSEGENCVEALRALGIVAISRMGSDKGEESVKRNFTALKNASVAGIVLIADNDDVGLKECEKFSRWASEVEFNAIIITTKAFWSEAPEHGDIVDFLREHSETTQAELLKLLERAIQGIQDAETSLRNSSKSTYQTSGNTALKPDTQSNVVPFQRQEPPKLPPIIEPITALINKNLQGSELEDEIQLIAEQYKRQPNNVWKIYYKRLEELEREDNKESQKESLEKLLRLDKKTLDLSNYLHPILATPLKNVAKWMGTSQEAILTTLLPVASSLIHLDTRLELLKPPVKFYANPIIWSGIVAESGSLKSPTQKLIIDPLYKMQSEIDSQYNLEFADYQEELSYYKKSKNDKNAEYTPEPKAPKRREYFTVDCTSEAMATIQSDQPERGFLGFQDELKALISSQNAYRGGKGSDTEKLLSGRDGSGIKVNRAGGKRLFCERSGFSITGGIQPDVLKQLMGDFSDPNGFWARFIWCNLPVAPSRYPEDFTSFDIDQLLTGIYKNLEAQPPQLHKLSPEAQEIYKDWYNQLDDLKLNEEIKQALRAVYSKFKRVTGEFALVLHRVNAATAGEMPEEFISKGTMEKAIRLAKFYISQVKLIHAEGAAEQGDIPSLLQKVLKLAEAKQRNKQQPLTASDVSNGIKALRGKGRAEEIRSIFMQLAEMGKGTIEGSGIRLKFRYSEIDPKIDQPKKPVSTTGKGIESLDNKKIDQVAQKIDQNRPKIDLLQESAFPMGKGVESLDDKKIDQIDRNSRPETIDQVGQLADPWTHHDGLEKNESIEVGSIRSIFSEGNPQNNCIEEDSGTNERSIFGSIFEGERSISEDERSIFSGNGERSPEPETEPLDFDNIKEGDILFDTHGQPHKITGRTRQLWETHRKQYISRNDILTGIYHQATIEDITKLIERTIKGKNAVQAKWLCDVYGGDANSLMAKAIDTNPEKLALIFDCDCW